MKKSTIFLVILIVLGLGAFFVFSSKDGAIPSDNELNSGAVVSKEAPDFTGEQYLVSPESSSVFWEGSKKLIPNYKDTGFLGIKEGSFFIEDGVLVGGSVIFDMNSIAVKSTGILSNEDRLARHLKSDDFFSVANYPTAEVLILKAELLNESENQYQLSGAMTIKGITQNITFPANISIGENEILIEGGASFDRTLWDIRYGSDKFFDNLADNVIDDFFSVEFKIVAVR